MDLNNWSNYAVVMGTDRNVNLRVSQKALNMLRVSPKNSLMLIHNHPRNSTFSTADITTFCSNDTLLFITVVANNGTIYVLKKGPNFKLKKTEAILNARKLGASYVLQNSGLFELYYFYY